MKTKSLSIKVSPAIGTVSAETIVPKDAKAIVTIAHGAGAGMNHTFMTSLAQSLAEKASLPYVSIFPLQKIKREDRMFLRLLIKRSELQF